MRVAFLFPRSDPHDALVNWVSTLRHHCRRHEVRQATDVKGCLTAECVFALTQRENYSPERLRMELDVLREWKIPHGVVHNQDRVSAALPGDYPSFAWTRQAMRNLANFKPVLLRQPVLPPCMAFRERPLHIGTFGRIEPKKVMLEMALWAHKQRIPFTVFGPSDWVGEQPVYVGHLKGICKVVLYPWTERVEHLAPLFEEVSHFLFVLPPGKGGSGGSPTTPRYATAFARPVVVVDDEVTFMHDGFYVRNSLADINHADLEGGMKPPSTEWGPDEYIDALCRHTGDFWRGR